MTFLEYLSILRRRWYYLLIGVLAGALGGYLTAPGTANAPDQFTATNTLLVDASTAAGANLNLSQSALLADTGPVPSRVVARLADEGFDAPSDVTAEADLELRSLEVTATSSSEEAAARAADLTAEEINAELARVDREVYESQIVILRAQVTESEARRNALVTQLATMALEDPLRTPVLEERDAVERTLLDLRSQLQQVESEGTPSPPLKVLEAAKGKPAAGFKLPSTRPARATMLGILGLLLGVIGALASDRLDTRVRGKEDAERAFELPVIAEIPPMAQSGGTRGRELVVATRPASPFVEAYRALRTVVLFAATEAATQAAVANASNGAGNGSGGHGDGTPDSPPAPRAQVVLVTSPSAGEGKTTTAAHLAAVLAEAGRRTLVISADFRRPRIHEYFDVPREPGLSDVLDSGTGRVRLSDLQMTTSFAGVHLMPSGSPVDNPAQLLAESADLIEAARHLFDYVVIDTPPLLVANDATELAAAADVVIMVAKADRTSRSASRRAAEVLRRVDAPILGVVISAAHDTPTAYGYYRYRYYSDTDQGTGPKKRFSRKQKVEPARAGVAVGANPDDDDDED